MKKRFTLLLALCFWLAMPAGNGDLIKVRNLYYKAASNKSEAENFYTCLQGSPGINGTLLEGYSGMSYMIRANHSWNPYSKLSYFNKGKGQLDKAIEKDPANTELRFLRFCVQTNAPGFLGYSGKIKEDKAVIITGYPGLQDEDLRSRIREYMKTSSSCTAQEKTVFK